MRKAYSLECVSPALRRALPCANMHKAFSLFMRCGNILRKTVGDTLTEFAYDRANQLVQSKVTNPGNPEILPKTTDFAYDAAGRLIKEDDKTYTYGYLDKVMAMHENPVNPANPVNPVKKSPVATFDYNVTGQLSSATRGTQTENFLWDGLALIHRDGVNYLNEPHAGGGAPVLASGGRASSRAETILFNDLLGTTVGSLGSDDTFTSSSLTAYGEDSPLPPWDDVWVKKE